MKIPHTVNSNFFKVYTPSPVSLQLVPESQRQIRSEDPSWDESHPPKLSELCVMVIVANFENNFSLLGNLPCWDKNLLLEILSTNLPLPLVVNYIDEQIYWERKVKDRWKDDANYCQNYGYDWKRMFLEKHLQETVEAMTPEGFDLGDVEALCNLVKDYVKVLDLRELQIMKSRVIINEDEDEEEEEEEDKFCIYPEPCEHIDLGPIITGLENLTELHVHFGLRNVGSDYKKSWFQFSLQDCRNLGAGVAQAQNLRLLRVHNCFLDDDRLIALLSSMEANTSLEAIDFSNCIIGDDGATGIAKFMKNRKSLKSINLCNNKIGEDGISALAFMITQSHASPIEYLNLKFNMFGDAGLKYLASALVREHPKIQVLKLSCCNLGDESGILLAEMLHRNTILIDLDLANNHFTDKSGSALEAAMEKNITIQQLDLRMTEISDEKLLNINTALHFNRIRAIKGEKGIEREKALIKKRAEEEQLRKEQEAREAEEAAAKAAAQEEAARIAAQLAAEQERDK